MPNPEQMPVIGMIAQGLTPSELDEVPIFGEVWRATNAVIDFAEYGCFPNWTVWARTLIPVTGDLILALVGFGMGDILRGYFRPNSIRGISGFSRLPDRKKGGKPGRLKRAGAKVKIPETGNLIGKKLPAAEFFHGRKVTGVEAKLWLIDGVAQRGLYYWMIADVVQDFIVNWTTAIMTSPECLESQGGEVIAQAHTNWVTFGNDWESAAMADVIKEVPPGLWDVDELTVPASANVTFSFTADPDHYFGDFHGGELGVFANRFDLEPIHSTGYSGGSAGPLNETTMATRLSGFTTYVFKMRGLDGYVEWKNMKIHISIN